MEQKEAFLEENEGPFFSEKLGVFFVHW